jgi:DNA (cytosine-5)-methyltransferase 1
MTTRYLSVCSGIEAASVAWHPLGWQPLAFAEIEAFPRAVLEHRWPGVPLHGDFTRLRDEKWIVDADVLVGGTPCQAFSVAGKRASLADDRGNLTLEFVRLADAIDDVRRLEGRDPSVLVWENVPGVLSVADNAFGCFLAALVGEDEPLVPPGGKWANAGVAVGPERQAAWRILDAQYFGVAQRRRRVFVVASARDGFDPAEVLLEWEGVRRDTPPSREAGKAAARSAGPSAAGGGERSHWDGDYPHPTLNQSAAGSGGVGSSNQEVFSQRGAYLAPAQAFGGNNTAGPINVAAALNACGTASGRQDFESETFVTMGAVAGPLDSNYGKGPGSRAGGEREFVAQVSGTLGAGGTKAKSAGTATSQDAAAGMLVAFHPAQDPISSADGSTHTLGCGTKGGAATVAVAFNSTGRGWWNEGDSAATLRAQDSVTKADTLALGAVAFAQNSRDEVRLMNGDGGIVGALSAEPGMKQTCYVAFSAKDHGADAGAIAPTLRAMGHGASHANGGGQVAVAFQSSQSGVRVADTHATLDANNGSRRHNGVVAPTTTAANDPSRSPQSSEITAQVAAVAAATSAVRRLTPKECERLQGFPDGYTAIPWKKKGAEECPDGPRYKALGNSMAVPVMRWIGHRVARELAKRVAS